MSVRVYDYVLIATHPYTKSILWGFVDVGICLLNGLTLEARDTIAEKFQVCLNT